MKWQLASLSGLTIGLLLSSTNTQAQSRRFLTGDAGMFWWIDAGAAIPQDGHVTEFGPLGVGQKPTYDVGPDFDIVLQ